MQGKYLRKEDRISTIADFAMSTNTITIHNYKRPHTEKIHILALIKANPGFATDTWGAMEHMVNPDYVIGANRLTTIIGGNEYHFIGIRSSVLSREDEILNIWNNNAMVANLIKSGDLVLKTDPKFDELFAIHKI